MSVATSPTHPPSSTELAQSRTSLAFERTFFAAERTLMAWVRTAMSMISFGFTIIKLFQYIESQRNPIVGPLFGLHWQPATVGITLISIGTVSLSLAVIQYRRVLRQLRQHGPVPLWSLAETVAVTLAALGLFALVTVLFFN